MGKTIAQLQTALRRAQDVLGGVGCSVDDPGWYLRRTVEENRKREKREREERRALEERTLDKLFEGNKHLSTLSATGLVLVLAAARLDVVFVDVLFGMWAFGLPLIISLFGMRVTLVGKGVGEEPRFNVTRLSLWSFRISSITFTLGIIFVVARAIIEGTN